MKIEKFRGNRGQRIVFANEDSERNRLIRQYLIRGSKKISRLNSRKAPNLQAREAAQKAILDLETHQPVGLLHLIELSKAIGRRITVHHPEENVNFTIGKRSNENPIDLEYHNGHWTLKNAVDPEIVRVAANDCLFEAVAAQIRNFTPASIRYKTIQEMKLNESNIAKELEDLMFLENWKDALKIMLGGAKYNGSSAADARRVIDNSQNGTCHPHEVRGHPRGHASFQNAFGLTDSIENYSCSGPKTGFLSREDQDFVGHLAFKTQSAQKAMERLNNGHTNETVRLDTNDLGDEMPLGCEFRYGHRFGNPQKIHHVIAVFRHFFGEYRNHQADVFVHTFYPEMNL